LYDRDISGLTTLARSLAGISRTRRMQTLKRLGPFLRFAFVLVVAFCALTEIRKLSKWFGRFFLWLMNLSHSSLTDWG
jgi:hypothetical protein